MPKIYEKGNTQKVTSNTDNSQHVEYSDQLMGTVHPRLGNKDLKFMKISTIIFAKTWSKHTTVAESISKKRPK